MGGPQQDIGVKAKLVNLIGAVRTLMRGTLPLFSAGVIANFLFSVPLIFINVGVILYELVLGG